MLATKLCLCLMAGLCLVQPAFAGPYGGFPEVSVGTNPHRHFGGEISGSGTETLMTVPDGQEFIVTGFNSNVAGVSTSSTGVVGDSGIQLLGDDTVLARGAVVGPYSGTSLSIGRARLRIEAGTTLSVQFLSPGGDARQYFVQGFLVHEGSPYRGFYGITPTAGHDIQTVTTTDGDRDFLIRTVFLEATGGGIAYCNLYVNDALVVHGSTNTLTGSSSTNSAFAAGSATISVPPGGTIQVETRGYYCEYYIDGEYLQP